MLQPDLNALYIESFRKHWDKTVVSNYEGNEYTMSSFATRIAQLHLLFEQCGIERGDKIALMGKDTAEWVMIFMAGITYGAVVVPILKDFSPTDAMAIIKHSESKMLFVNHSLWNSFTPSQMPSLHYALSIQKVTRLYYAKGARDLDRLLQSWQESFHARYPKGYSREDLYYRERGNQELCILNYTSGTTGFSKGVMITGNNILGNLLWCRDHDIVREGDRLLSFLPLAHTYGCMINVLFALISGVHVVFLGKAPTPSLLSSAFKRVQPDIIISVPLVIEKIYTNVILPKLKGKTIRTMLSLPILREVVHRKVCTQLMQGMGGRARMVIVGGAALNPEVATFLKKIGFPIVVGYGMTECAPLISFTPNPKAWRLGSCGQVLEGYMQARIAEIGQEEQRSKDQLKKGYRTPAIGEIQVKGENTCLGYYKNPEQTKALFTEDGWLRTGDLGYIDDDGFIFIKGRIKTMLLGASGQNIYPEEIEAKIGLLPYVQESLVVMRNGKLEALIVLNTQQIELAGKSADEAWESLVKLRGELNEQLGRYEQIQRFELHAEPFLKTPKQSIKRYLYK